MANAGFNPAHNLSYENLLLANNNSNADDGGSLMIMVCSLVMCCCCCLVCPSMCTGLLWAYWYTSVKDSIDTTKDPTDTRGSVDRFINDMFAPAADWLSGDGT
jgi:nitrous oxide reductase accessory protein NosL